MSEHNLIRYKQVELCQKEHIVLKNVDLEIGDSQFIYLLGRVGSGKSTFLKSLYGEIPVQEGEASMLGFDLKKLKRKELPLLRRKIGIVFQDFQLMEDRNVFENLEFVLRATGWKNKKAIKEQIDHVLEQVGMQNKDYKRTHELSGGEQQRIVIARALLNSPQVILADEPTGNLDPTTGSEIMRLLYSIREAGTTIIIATHNHDWKDSFPGKILMCANSNIKEIDKEEISNYL